MYYKRKIYLSCSENEIEILKTSETVFLTRAAEGKKFKGYEISLVSPSINIIAVLPSRKILSFSEFCNLTGNEKLLDSS